MQMNLELCLWEIINSFKIQGTGNITLKLHDGNKMLLINVRYVPGLKKNLISLGTLDELGFWYKAEKGSLHVYNNRNLILCGTKRNGLYVLDGCFHASAKTDTALMINSGNIVLWHLHLSHIG